MVFVGRMVPILVWMTQTVMVPVDTSLEVMGTAVSHLYNSFYMYYIVIFCPYEIGSWEIDLVVA
jgi:hypothetical protein